MEKITRKGGNKKEKDISRLSPSLRKIGPEMSLFSAL